MKKIFGIIGNPIKHSLSPVLHNYWFNKYGIDAEYSFIEASDKDLPEIINKIKHGKYFGINVTLPFKQKIINHIDKIINDAELTGSVNTVLLNENKTVGTAEQPKLPLPNRASGIAPGKVSANPKNSKSVWNFADR